MIYSSEKLKVMVRKLSQGDSAKAQILFRNYVMERFLERLSLSPYQKNLILKGGALVSAMVGLDNRSTMDVDATLKGVTLSEESARKIVEEICGVPVDDGMTFEIQKVTQIMDEADYPGIRIMMEATLESMRTPLKLDFSTDDVITPREVVYAFRLLFEDRTISILAYNLETVLAEKLETLLSRGTANTRMRDFYDLYALSESQEQNIDPDVLKAAFANTCRKRTSSGLIAEADMILSEVEESPEMVGLWKGYQKKFDYAADLNWHTVMQAARRLKAVAIGV